jgi:hypothetical protein
MALGITSHASNRSINPANPFTPLRPLKQNISNSNSNSNSNSSHPLAFLAAFFKRKLTWSRSPLCASSCSGKGLSCAFCTLIRSFMSTAIYVAVGALID